MLVKLSFYLLFFWRKKEKQNQKQPNIFLKIKHLEFFILYNIYILKSYNDLNKPKLFIFVEFSFVENFNILRFCFELEWKQISKSQNCLWNTISTLWPAQVSGWSMYNSSPAGKLFRKNDSELIYWCKHIVLKICQFVQANVSLLKAPPSIRSLYKFLKALFLKGIANFVELMVVISWHWY